MVERIRHWLERAENNEPPTDPMTIEYQRFDSFGKKIDCPFSHMHRLCIKHSIATVCRLKLENAIRQMEHANC